MRHANQIDQRTSSLNKARQLIDKGRLDDALAILQDLIAVRKEDTESRYFLALAYLKAGQSALALDELIRVVADQPEWADAHALLGETLRILGRPDDAIACLRHALSLNENNVVALTGLGYLLHNHQTAIEEAVTLLERAVAIEPSNANAHSALATALFGLERAEEGLRHGRKSLKLAPGDSTVYIRFASLLQYSGNKEEANRMLEKACDLDPAAGSSYLVLAGTQRFTEGNRGLIRRMEAALDLPMSIADRDNLHFALGKAHDDLQEWDQAFEHYRRANSLVRASYDARVHASEIKNLTRFFAAPFFRRQPVSDCEEAPIFIVGMPRSGSTLVEQMLSAHPDVRSIGESREIANLMDALCLENQPLPSPSGKANARPFPFCLEHVSAARYRRAADDYLRRARLGGEGSGSRILDKQLFNFGNLGMIRCMFPGARILHTRRHPLDTCLSCYFQRFEFNKVLGWAYDLRSAGLFYRRYRETMEHWRQVFPMPILDVDYAEVVARPEEQARRILDFCGLDWDPTVMAFHRQQRVVQTASHEQVRQPIYTRSLARWTHYAKHLQPLADALGDVLEESRPELEAAGIQLGRSFLTRWGWSRR